MTCNSNATILVWKIAALEARHLNHKEIDPIDLMLGILKIVDVDLAKIVDVKDGDDFVTISGEVKELTELFLEASIDAKSTRRRLRRESIHQGQLVQHPDGVIHRSNRTKDVFRRAIEMLSGGDSRVLPIHILAALLDKHEPELERLLILVNSPVHALVRILSTKIRIFQEAINHEFQDSFKNDPTGSDQLIRFCRSAIGYLELGMLDEALKELEKISPAEQDHHMVKHLKNEIRHSE